MKQSESITNLLRSLISAQSKINAGVKKDATNDVFAAQYATLGAVISATKEVLLAENIVVLQSPGEYVNGQISMTTRLCHGSGEWIEGVCSSPLMFLDPQGFGSAVSYLRRYALTSMLGLYQSDDDAGVASPRGVDAGVSATFTVPGNVAGKTAGGGKPADAALEMKLQQWRTSIANANVDRLKTAKETAKSIFTGEALNEITDLIDRHLAALDEPSDVFTV